MQVIDLPLLMCHRCAYVWYPSQPVIRICPRCKSSRWDKPKIRRDLGPRTGLGIEEVIGPHRAQLTHVFRRHRVKDVRIFGSVRRGQATAQSDVDLLVHFPRGASLSDEFGLKADLEEVLGRAVDLGSESGLHPLVRPQVLYEAVPL